MRVGDVFKPVAGEIGTDGFKDAPWYDAYKAENEKLGWGWQSAFWSDRNGDMAIQLEELTPQTTKKLPRGYWGVWVDEALAIYGSPQGSPTAYRLKPERVLPNGVPVYDLTRVETFGPPEKVRGTGNYAMGDPATGDVYVLGGGIFGQKTWPGMNKYADDGTHLCGNWRVATDWNEALKRGIPPKGDAW
jgi:hypothetical protein